MREASYGQRLGRCAEPRIDELVWGRQRVVCTTGKGDQEEWAIIA